ncbi:MAG: EscU/YscU/HrcU family type III secretion system export apparatus switch protein [Planctomycetaceae bacterium]
MAEGQEHNGTEEPTERHRERARESGDVVQSHDLNAALTLLVACGAFMMFGRSLGMRLMAAIQLWTTDIPADDWTEWHIRTTGKWMSFEAVALFGGVLLAVMATGLLISFMQVGFVISTKSLEIKWDRVLPSNGWGKLWSLESGIRGLQGSAKMILLSLGTLVLLWLRFDRIANCQFDSVGQVVSFAWDLGLTIGIMLGGLSLALAMTDYLIKWLRHEQRLKMTREQQKEESKDSNGDPHVRDAMRRKRRELAQQQSTKNAKNATVVLTNPTHLAIALQYETGRMAAPKVVAKGAGVFAKNIVRIARENNIPVLERKPLARALFASADVGQDIPFEFFRAVAEILSQIYRARQAA